MGKKKKSDDVALSVEDFWSPDSEDQYTKARGNCMATDHHVAKYFQELKICTERVQKKIEYTAETCHQEMVDMIQAVDHCIGNSAFGNIK